MLEKNDLVKNCLFIYLCLLDQSYFDHIFSTIYYYRITQYPYCGGIFSCFVGIL